MTDHSFRLAAKGNDDDIPKRGVRTFFENGLLKLKDFEEEYGKDVRFGFSVAEELKDQYKDTELYRILDDIDGGKFQVSFSYNNSADKNFLRFYNGNTALSGEALETAVNELRSLRGENDPKIKGLPRTDLTSREIFNEMKKKGYTVKTAYVMMQFDCYLMNAFKHIFLYSYLHCLYGKPFPKDKYETLTIRLDPAGNTAVLTDLGLIEPETELLIKAFRSRYIGNYNSIAPAEVPKDKDDPINYYEKASISGWQKYSGKDLNAPDSPGIYMLFDSKRGHLYVGKAKLLKKRILQHRKPGDPIPDFDYYRFSEIAHQKKKELFILENTAIHDLAMLFFMPKGPVYKNLALNSIFGNISFGNIRLVNTAETQTKWEKEDS